MRELTREQQAMIRRFSGQLAIEEYRIMREIGFTADLAAEHAIVVSDDFKRIADGA